jgi:hypothetical protein
MTQGNNESITEKRERLFRELDEGRISAMEFWEGIRKTFEGFNPDEVRQGYQEAIERIKQISLLFQR